MEDLLLQILTQDQTQTFEWIIIGLLGSAVIGLGVKHFTDQSNHIKELYDRDRKSNEMIIRMQETQEALTEMVKEMKIMVAEHEKENRRMSGIIDRIVFKQANQ